ncbi:MAG: FtsW/RodA/SpoVE family cell cycle protein [Hyphomonadaceae bacterium]|nr:MAG: cell division protein FtsW [Caulobacteraceae bacterium]MBT9447394.1 FtsW/RodA/SpoVE family cell cycle protein [Hyphomonadaceae bacterium]TPW04459.1 MAG: cell division protein FtsW [Alphaproteobacteria bacterium]
MNGVIGQVRQHERALLVSSGLLLLFGFLYALTVSPNAAARMGYDSTFSLALRQGGFALIGALAIAGASFLPATAVRRAGVLLFLGALVLLLVVLFAGHTEKGAQRWIRMAGFSLQPSELVKPALVIAMAWMLSAGVTQRRFPGVALALGLYGVTAALLVAQPDYGQTALLGMVLAAMLLTAGAPWRIFAAGAVAAGVGGVLAYNFSEHFRRRIDLFLDPDDKGGQVTKALEAMQSGGVLGRGPGEGIVKVSLPDAHADFVYAAATEEFGWLASLGFIGLYAAIAWFGLRRASRLVDPFQQFAASGLIFLFTLQAAIHVAVNAGAAPAKGLTLPLVSYGGSAMIGSALTIGLAFALLRERPGAFLHDRTHS